MDIIKENNDHFVMGYFINRGLSIDQSLGYFVASLTQMTQGKPLLPFRYTESSGFWDVGPQRQTYVLTYRDLFLYCEIAFALVT